MLATEHISVLNAGVTSKHKCQYFMLFLSKVLVLAHIPGTFLLATPRMRCCFQYNVSSVWSYIPGEIAQTRNQNKTVAFAVIKRHLQLQKKRIRWRTAVSQRDFSGAFKIFTGTLCRLASLYCLLYFLAFDWFRQPEALSSDLSETIQINP